LALNGPWDKNTGHTNSLRDPKKVRKVLTNLGTFDLPSAEELADSRGDTSVQAWMGTDNHAALLAYLEHEATRPDDDPDKLPPQALARIRAVSTIPAQLGWPVFRG
jgi:hypothetical protein